MAIFKDKTGRGEVDYAKSPVQSSDGTILFLNDHTALTDNIFAKENANHLVFQLRGETTGTKDISDNKFSVTESSALTKRQEFVTHTQKLKTFEFTSGKTVTISPQIQPASLRIALNRPGMSNDGNTSPSILPYGQTMSTPYKADTGRHLITLSFWVYVEDYGTGTDGGGSCIMETVSGTSRTFGIILSSTGELSVRFYDWGANSTAAVEFQELKTVNKISKKTWTHVTVFFTGFGSSVTNLQYNSNGLDGPHQNYSTAGTPAYSSSDFLPQVQIYLNATKQTQVSESGKTSGTFAGTLGTGDNLPLVIGTGLAGYDNGAPQFQSGADANFNGRLAEICYFYTVFIGNDDGVTKFQIVSSGYRDTVAKALMTGNRQPTSGITNISERLLLRENDQHSSHPTVKRSGDQRRLGNHTVKFDDSRAQTLKGATVQYPTKLVEGDNLINTIYSGYFNGNLTLQHTASVESYDTFYRRNDQPSHEPFIESRIYIDSGSQFYQTGTLESVLPGFDQPLKSKEIIRIIAVNQSETKIGYDITSENVAAPGDVSQQSRDIMAYFDFQNNQFTKLLGPSYVENGSSNEVKTTHTKNNLTGSAVGFGIIDTILSSSGMLPNDPLSAADFDNLTLSSYDDNYYSAFANPIENFGFPNADHYNQDRSKCIKLSEYINEPFLLEKVVFKFPQLIAQTFRANTSGTRSGGFLNVPVSINFSSAPYLLKSMLPFDGHENLTAFLLHQQNVPSSFSVTNEFAMRTGDSQSFLQKNYSSSTSRNIVTYGNNLFLLQDPGYLTSDGSGGYTNTTDPDHGNNQSIRYSQMGIPGNDGSGFPYVVTFSGSINNTGISNFIDVVNKFGVENISLGTRTNANRASSFGTSAITASNVEIKTVPKIAKKIDFGGTISCHMENSAGAFVNENALLLKWQGEASNNNYDSPRLFANGKSGKSNPVSQKLGLLGGNNSNQIAVETTSSKSVKSGSVYVLMPEDELIFGVQGTVELNFDPVSGEDRSFIRIPASEIEIQLFGSYLKNSQPRQFQLNQLLNNDIVHEAIGQEAIHDQFDVEPRGAFTGSYADEIISGSTTAPYNGFNASIHVDGAGADDFTDLARRVNGRVSEGTQGTTGSLRRNVSIASADKTEYDSFLFDLESMFKVDLPTGITNNTTNYYNDYLSGQQKLDFLWFGNVNAPNGSSKFGTQPPITSNQDIRGSFLMDRYNNATRVRSSQIGGGNNKFLLEMTGTISSGRLDGGFGADNSSAADAASGNILLVDKTGNGITDNGFASKFIFTLGDGTNNSHRVTNPTPAMGLSAGSYFVFNEQIRGFRYGLSNIVDKKPRNVFRRNKYGQLRDMLEMAPNTAYIDDQSNTISYPIEAQFFDADGSVASANSTSCSNLSTNVTSSAPFFDRDLEDYTDDLVVRNRGPLNNAVVDITIEI